MDNQRKILSGFIWSFGERIIAQMVSLVVGVVLARVLAPEDYGAVSIVMIFITLCNIFVNSGFGTAIVRQKEAGEIDFNTAFLISLTISVILYALMFVGAPYVADFYGMDVLKPVMRVFGIRILISAINTIQHAYIQRQMLYKKFFIATLFGTIISCVVGISMAYSGCGVWALVAQYMTNTMIDTIVLLFVGGWRPKLQFSLACARRIYSFGWKMLCSQLVCTLSKDVRGLIIGKVFGPDDLAYYEQGNKYPAVIGDNINVAITKVMLPAFAQNQDNLKQLKNMLRKSIRMGIFVVAPVMCGFAAVAPNFVRVILTDKWLPAVPFIQIMCLAYVTRPLEEFCHRAILALGKSDTSMWIMIIINTVSLTLTLFAAFVLRQVIWVSLSYLVHTFCSLLCFMVATRKYIDYQFGEQLRDIVPAAVLSLLMCFFVSFLGRLQIGAAPLLILQLVTGMVIYPFLACLFKLDACAQLVSMMKKYVKH